MFTAMSKMCRLGSLALLSTTLLLAMSSEARAQGKKGKGPKGPPPGTELLTVRGIVKDFTTAPKGEKDGVMLTDGTWVHWPPHLADRFTSIVSKGDKVKVMGWLNVDKEGRSKLEVSSLTNLAANETRLTDVYTPAVFDAWEKFGPGKGEFVTANGTVKELTTAPKGEVDGFILNDGRWVHWPPHLASRFADAVVKGDKVRVTGYWETGTKGETKLEVSTLTVLRTNKTIENPDRPAPSSNPQTAASREERIRALESQVEQLTREIQRLRKEK